MMSNRPASGSGCVRAGRGFIVWLALVAACKTPVRLPGLAERIATGFGRIATLVRTLTQSWLPALRGPITFFERTKLSSVVPPGDGEPESAAGA